ncbi:Glutathione transport system permease protein GsiD [Candidatus Entotheonellaceae bacterium PAL068K]
MALSDTQSLTRTLTFPTEEEWLQGLRGRRVRKHIPIALGMVMVLLMLFAAVLAPLISPFSPSAQFSDYVLKGPGAGGRHLLGTDEFGRDVLSRIIWGTRISLEVGLGAVVVGFLMGVPLGILAGFVGGKIETMIMRVTDMMMAFPQLLLALMIVAALGGSLIAEIIAIGIAMARNFVRLARSLALTIKENDYIMAARAVGGSHLRIMFRHIFPNTVSTLMVIATLYIAQAIRTEAGLSFLGLGVPLPTPSWGNILSEGRQFIRCCHWLTTFSGLAIMFAVLAFNLMGDTLRDLLDPRLRGE